VEKRTTRTAAVFIDRDGTLIHEKNYLSKVKDVRLFAKAVDGLRLLQDAGYKLIMVTNQSGIGRGYFTEKKLHQVHAYLEKLLLKKGVKLDAIYYCPHHPDEDCDCRKPKLGMVKRARRELNVDLKRSYTIGDHKGDFLLGQNMGGTGIFVLTGHGKHEYEKIKKSNGALNPDRVEKSFYTAAKWIAGQKKVETHK
jgi:histidinol-phosphate phosphatase family protein